MEEEQRLSNLPILISRARMLGEDQIPDEVLQKMLPNGGLDIFMKVEDPDQWPASMQPFRNWIEQNVPPEYWAEFED
ncbi:MAG: hypothetical protein NOF05_10100 [Candidatus Accumulibacter phosphatis]|nr:hypothetical protein [Candidatus Accumulibacter phosphatis]